MEKKSNWVSALDAILAETSLGDGQKATAKVILTKLKESKDAIRELERTVSAPDLANALRNAADDVNDAMASVLSIGAERNLNVHICKGSIVNLDSGERNLSDEIEKFIQNS